MRFSMNSSVENRKALVHRLGELTGIKPHYDGVPKCTYTVGEFTVLRDGGIETEESPDCEILKTLREESFIDFPAEPEEQNREIAESAELFAQDDGETSVEDEVPAVIGLSVEVPLESVNLENLRKLLDAKGNLIRKALGIRSTDIEVRDDKVAFPWFEEIPAENAMSASKFISALCRLSKEAKRVTATARDVENEKYAFRCFLLRLGFIGAEYKEDRKILLQNLSGSSAYKNRAGKEAADDAVSR